MKKEKLTAHIILQFVTFCNRFCHIFENINLFISE
jgi:hypothetical protein